MTYEDCVAFGAEGVDSLKPFLRETVDGFVLINKSALAKHLQTSGQGDVLINWSDGRLLKVEVKSERRFTGNFFMEDWSNEGVTPGWLRTLNVDIFIYQFPPRDLAFAFLWRPLKSWVERGIERASFPYIPQTKTKQRNKTMGFLVPVRDATRAVNAVCFFPKQLKFGFDQRTLEALGCFDSQ